MDFSWLFQAFSRRREKAQPPKPLPREFRNRVLLLCRDAFGSRGALDQFWHEVQQKLAYLHGRPILADGSTASAVEDVLLFLHQCSDDHFLDFVEFIFRTDACTRIDATGLVDSINQFLGLDDLAYVVTRHVWEKTTRREFGREFEGQRLVHYPQVILRGSQAAYAVAVEPALTLLADPAYGAANAEYLAALADYRKKDYGDCLTKCGSAFESTMKLICKKRGWQYDERDTAAPLLKTIVSKGSLESYFEQPLMIVATIRNRQSSAHGAGGQPRQPGQDVAEYALTATAAAILFLVRRFG